MGLDLFIKDNVDAIVSRWEALAPEAPAARAASTQALRDRRRGMLLALVGAVDGEPPRQVAGLDPAPLFAEFQALRASVTAAWRNAGAADTLGAAALDALARFNEGLDQAIHDALQRHAGEAAAARDMFLAVLGHDLRVPLAGIEMSAFLLSKPGLAETPRRQAAARVKKAARDLGRRVTDLLEYTRLRLGTGMQATRAPCDLGLLCGDAVDAARAAHPRQRFSHRLSGELAIDADAPRLRQVLATLLDNAVQHGGPESPVMLVAQGQADSVVLKVINGGPPIPAQALRSIFEARVRPQGEGADTQAGLGLFIAREAVRGHGGTIEVESASGIGTVFTLRLPRDAATRN